MVLDAVHPTTGPLRQIGIPLTDANALPPAPPAGGDTETVLRNLGYDDDGVAALRETGVI